MRSSKIFILALSFVFLTACSSTPSLNVQKNISEENRQKYLTAIEEQTPLYKNSQDIEKIEAAENIAFSQMMLGNYDTAAKLYKEIIAFDNQHYPALNNLSDIYLENNILDQAIFYQTQLLEANPTDERVLQDLIQLFVKDQQFDNALTALETYIKLAGDNNYDRQFTSGLFEYIMTNNPNANVPL